MTRTTWLGGRRIDLLQCGSTNDEARRLAARGAPHGTLITSRAQFAGRGRLGGEWYSPSDENLYFSVILRPEMEVARVPPITLATGLAVADAVSTLGVAVRVKWPNDILAAENKLKLAGILTETSSQKTQLEHVVVGVGINVNTLEFPPHLSDRATSLALELGGRKGYLLDPEPILQRVLVELERRLDAFFGGGARALIDEWVARTDLVGRRVRVSLPLHKRIAGYPRAVNPDRSWEGHVHGFDDCGMLLVRNGDGEVRTITAGGILLLD